MKNLYLLRGLPGSGKSTLAEQLGGSHFETDKYFIGENGEYNFDGSKLKEAQVDFDLLKAHGFFSTLNNYMPFPA